MVHGMPQCNSRYHLDYGPYQSIECVPQWLEHPLTESTISREAEIPRDTDGDIELVATEENAFSTPPTDVFWRAYGGSRLMLALECGFIKFILTIVQFTVLRVQPSTEVYQKIPDTQTRAQQDLTNGKKATNASNSQQTGYGFRPRVYQLTRRHRPGHQRRTPRRFWFLCASRSARRIHPGAAIRDYHIPHFVSNVQCQRYPPKITDARTDRLAR